ncbi:unnamed protein product [Hermetia illucens]|uniref:WD repeat-containing protein 74 n=1 Tax=Hermetia illucens TaxID=343691 RepID=A0A7R8UUX8_HERIL|nr:WD repeat-containing protein 74 [Hermetia illucens]CAD7087580.1 unnamed protein product [Hermetia illucens]
MKWTTANSKNANYTENHEIYVGTHTGSFKKLDVAAENPHAQTNLQSIQTLTKDSKITALSYGNQEETEILIGRLNKFVKIYDLPSNEYTSNIELAESPIVGLNRYDGKLVAGFASGKLSILTDPEATVLTAGDCMSRMRQCAFDGKLVATGGKERQNNLKIFNLESMKQVFSSKNLPNDFLNLEVPTWDSDMAFLDVNRVSTCSRYGYVRYYDTRAQRRPVALYSAEDQMSFACLIAKDPYVYCGTTMGALKAFDTRNMKNFVHTYKGFTGSVSDLALDHSGKFIVSGSLDRYVRVHQTDSCVMLYQCYVKSKVTRVLVRDATAAVASRGEEDDSVLIVGEANGDEQSDDDDEYNALFDQMPTIRDAEKDGGDDLQSKVSKRKRKSKTNDVKKKKKH